MSDTEDDPPPTPTVQPVEADPEAPVVIPAAALLEAGPSTPAEPFYPTPAETVAAPSLPSGSPGEDGDAPLHPEASPPEPSPSAPRPVPPFPAKAKGRGRWVKRILLVLGLVLFVFPPVLTLIYKVVPPPLTVLMVERMVQGQGLDKSWRGLSDISPALPQAVIAAEDARFCQHHGFDFQAMQKAALHNERRPGKIRGGSTISQQTAKNVFLWPSRDYLRKGLEAYFTVLEEAIWGKRRILETYLNVVEWGPGTYGAQAASQRYFHKDAKALSGAEAARLAAILPSPLKWNAVNPGRYVQRRSARIDAAENTVREDDLAWCVRR